MNLFNNMYEKEIYESMSLYQVIQSDLFIL